jgi:hypothetical protein
MAYRLHDLGHGHQKFDSRLMNWYNETGIKINHVTVAYNSKPRCCSNYICITLSSNVQKFKSAVFSGSMPYVGFLQTIRSAIDRPGPLSTI